MFPKEGKVLGVNPVIERFFIEKFGYSDSKMSKNQATAMGWNENSYWYIKNFNASKKPVFTNCYIEDIINNKIIIVENKKVINKTLIYEIL
jgi:hypothetical protein